MHRFHTPFVMLAVMTVAMQLAFAAWWTLTKNFAVEGLGFTGREIGFQESIREIPGFLAFLAVYMLWFMRERTLALLSLALLGGGVAATGYFPTLWGFYATTFVMSVGYHYYETMYQSLSLQWLPRAKAPALLGKLLAWSATAQLVAYGLIFVGWKTLDLSFTTTFLVAGLACLALTVWLTTFPQFAEGVPQNKSLVLRRRYWLYYALTFMSGARRQIFTVFAGFLMVERFGYAVSEVALLFLVNCLFNMAFAGRIGALIGRIGERRALIFEYCGLIGVFVSYAFVTDATVAGALYVIDHGFFALAIAIKTYFQKIADPADMAPTAGVAFTINHIAAVFIPAVFGLVWLVSPAAVFLAGAAMACVSLLLSILIPDHPDAGMETRLADLKARARRSGASPRPT